jgi:hypothetical protein
VVFNFSGWVDRVHPDLRDLIEETSEVARWLDPNIPHEGVLVCARRSHTPSAWKYDDYWSGLAHPTTESFVGYGPDPGEWTHPDGRIDLRIGLYTNRIDKIRLVAHELRHLGQFVCGRRQNGYLDMLLKNSTCEQDAEAFENVVLDTMRARTGKM